MLGTLGEYAATADAWLKALDRVRHGDGGPLSDARLFMSFLRDRQWAWRSARAYNTFMHEEFTRKSPRLKAVALWPLQDPEAATVELRRGVRELGCVAPCWRRMGAHLLGDARFTPIYEEAQRPRHDAGRARVGLASRRRRARALPAFIRRTLHRTRFGQCPAHLPRHWMDSRALSEAAHRLFLEAAAGWAPY